MNQPLFETLHQIIKKAKSRLTQEQWDYLTGGAETETTVKRNRQALDRIAFRPRVLRRVTDINVTTDFLGHTLRMPVLLAPVGGLELFGAGGGASVAKAAAQFGVSNILSSVSEPSLQETAAAADSPMIYQFYVRDSTERMDDVTRQAVDAGYMAFCLTIDTAVYSRRERDIVHQFVKPWRAKQTGRDILAELTWDHVKHFKDIHNLPLILKGIATREDALIAVDHGVDMIYVSNHGGRQLDHGRGAIEVLPEVVEAVDGRAKVIVDSGFSRGTDIIKAIALGADYVGIGRLYCYGLAAAGVDGIVNVLELLEEEMIQSMGLLGVTQLADLGPEYLHQAAPVDAADVFSAFPLMHLDDKGY